MLPYSGPNIRYLVLVSLLGVESAGLAPDPKHLLVMPLSTSLQRLNPSPVPILQELAGRTTDHTITLPDISAFNFYLQELTTFSTSCQWLSDMSML